MAIPLKSRKRGLHYQERKRVQNIHTQRGTKNLANMRVIQEGEGGKGLTTCAGQEKIGL